MKHISTYGSNFTPIIKPPYTVFIKNGIMLLGFNDGRIFPRQVKTSLISCVEKHFYCKCTAHVSNSKFKAFLNQPESIINLSDDFILNINGENIEGVRNVFYENIEDVLLRCTFEVDCNIETLKSEVYFADPILENISKKLKLTSIYGLNLAYKTIQGLDKVTMHNARQFMDVGVPLTKELGYERIQNGVVDFQEFHQALEKFLEK